MDRQVSRRAFLGSLTVALGAAGAGCQGTADDPLQGDANAQVQSESDSTNDDTAPTSEYEAVYERVANSVATVRTYSEGRGGGQGSAFVYDENHLVTNDHVVDGAEELYVRYRDSGWLESSVVATDAYSDLAALEVTDKPSSATPLSFAQAEPGVGTEVVAIGNPFGLSGSVSAGIVSGVDRTLPAANGFSISDAIQTDAAVNPGNSGGPLVNLDGEIVGVINSGGGDNIGFAISAPLTQRVIPSLIENGNYEHSYMGVRLMDVTPTVVQANDLGTARGVYIDEIVDGGPSEGVLQGSDGERQVDGITTPVGGDVVLRMDGTPTPARQQLSAFLALETSPGQTIDVEVLRDGSQRTVELELGNRPPVN